MANSLGHRGEGGGPPLQDGRAWAILAQALTDGGMMGSMRNPIRWTAAALLLAATADAGVTWVATRLGIGITQPALVQRVLDPLQREVARWARFNDPRHLYSYCFCGEVPGLGF